MNLTLNGINDGQVVSALDGQEKTALFLTLGCGLLGLLLPFSMMKLLLAVLLAGGFLVLSIRAYYIGLAFFIFLLPFQALIPIDSILFRGLNIQTGFVLYFLLLAFLGQSQRKRNEESFQAPRNPITVPLWGLFFVVLASCFHTFLQGGHELGNLLSTVKNWFAYCLLAFLAFRCVRTSREKLFVLGFVFVAVLLNVGRSLEYSLSHSSALLSNRAVSFIETQPNLYAGFLAVYLFFFIAFLMLYPLSTTRRLLFALLTGLVVINLIYTLSRGAWMACIITAVLVASTKYWKLWIPALLIGICLMYWMPEVAVERWQSTGEQGYHWDHLTQRDAGLDDAALRVVQWKTFLPLLAQSPLWGSGFARYPEMLFNTGHLDTLRSAHSTIIELGVEEGLIGLFFYGWLLMVIFRNASRLFRTSSDPVDRVLALGLLSATACLFFLDLSGTRFRNSNVMAYYWILTGLTLNALPVRDRTQPPERE